MSDVVRAHRGVDQATGRKKVSAEKAKPAEPAKPAMKATPAAREALQQAKAAATPEKRREAVNKVEPREVIQAGEEEIEKEGEKVKKAAASLDTDTIVSSLSDIEGVLKAIQSSLQRLSDTPGGRKDQTSLSDLVRQTGDLRSRGSTLDANSTPGLLWKINQTLKGLSARTGKSVEEGPKDIEGLG